MDMVILYQLPSKNNSSKNILQTIINDEVPVLFILGKQSSITGFNKFFDGLNIISGVSTFTNAQFEKNSLFSMYSLDNKLANQLSSFPPLLVPMGNYQLSDGLDVFGWQRISDITTDFPLIAYNNKLGVRSGVISGEGIWQWRIQNYLKYNTSDAVDAFLNKSVMFLIADSDKRKFKIITKGEYDNNHDIELTAELYDESLKLFNSADVTLSLVNEDNEQFNYVFSPFNDYYKLNLNKLPVGIYTYLAKVNNAVSPYSDKGEFIVKEINNESRNLNANHRMLSRLAEVHDGGLYYPNHVADLEKEILELTSLKPIIHYQDKFISINTLPYIMLLLLLLLSIEWFLRKYFGNY